MSGRWTDSLRSWAYGLVREAHLDGWMVGQGKSPGEGHIQMLDRIGPPPDSATRASKDILVVRTFFGVGCGEHGNVSYRDPKKPNGGGALYGVPLDSILEGANAHNALVRVTVEILQPGEATPKNPWLAKR